MKESVMKQIFNRAKGSHVTAGPANKPLPTEAQQRTQWLHGKLASVDAAHELLYLLAPTTGTPLVIHWLPETLFLNNGLASASAELQPGQSLAILYRTSQGNQMFATEINIEVRPPLSNLGSNEAEPRPPRFPSTRE